MPWPLLPGKTRVHIHTVEDREGPIVGLDVMEQGEVSPLSGVDRKSLVIQALAWSLY